MLDTNTSTGFLEDYPVYKIEFTTYVRHEKIRLLPYVKWT